MFAAEIARVRRLGVRNILLQGLVLASALAPVGMAWLGFGLLMGCASPVVVVLSGSMEPAFYRGDLILLSAAAEYAVGDIVVYNVPGQPIPIVHRVLETRAAGVRTLFLTKGDNNAVDDLELYGGREWLEHEHIVGAVRGYIPYVGYVTIAMNDFPQLKYALFGGLGLLALVRGEQ